MWLLALQILLVGWAWTTGWKGWALIPFFISLFINIAVGVSQALVDIEAGTYGEPSEPIFLGVVNVLFLVVLFVMAVAGRKSSVSSIDQSIVPESLNDEAPENTKKNENELDNTSSDTSYRKPSHSNSAVSLKGFVQLKSYKVKKDHKQEKVPVISYLCATIFLLLSIAFLSELISELNANRQPDQLNVFLSLSFMIASTLIGFGLVLRSRVAYISSIIVFSIIFLIGMIGPMIAGLQVQNMTIPVAIMLISGALIYGLVLSY